MLALKGSSDGEQHQYLDVAEVMAGVAAAAIVDQNSMEPVHQRLLLGFTHEGVQVQVLWISDILESKTSRRLMSRFVLVSSSLRHSADNGVPVTLVIFLPVTMSKRFRTRVRTLVLWWMVSPFVAVTMVLQLR